MTFADLPCRWRGAEIPPGRCMCRSPKLRVSPQGVSLPTCAGCALRDHAPPRPQRDPRKPRLSIAQLAGAKRH